MKHSLQLNQSGPDERRPKLLNWQELPSGTLGEVLGKLSQSLSQFPRRTPGSIQIEGRIWEFSDLHGFFHQAAQIFHQRLYAVREGEKFCHILDAGAHTGLASLFFAQNHPNASIHAFEADHEIFQLLERNIARWNLSRVQASQSAVWIHDRGVNFSSTGDDSGFVDSGASSGNPSITPSIGLREMLHRHSFDLVKLDIEGAEFQVIPQAADSLHLARNWIIEIHQFPHVDKSHSLDQIIHCFRMAGFECALGDFHAADWIQTGSPTPFVALNNPYFVVTLFAWRSESSGAAQDNSVAGGARQKPVEGTQPQASALSLEFREACQKARHSDRRGAQIALKNILHSHPFFTPAKSLLDWMTTEPVYISSFPGSGHNWLRQLLTDLILQRQGLVTQTELPLHPDEVIPETDRHNAYHSHPVAGLDRPWMSSHLPASELDGKILVLQRLPEEALVSLYHSHQGSEELRKNAGQDIQAFCLARLPDWILHTQKCHLAARHNPRQVRIVHLESLLTTPLDQLKSIADFLGLPNPDARILQALTHHPFGNPPIELAKETLAYIQEETRDWRRFQG